jgi:hypothetical protein
MIPVIIGATGTISESLRQYMSNKPGKREIKELQKKSHIGLCTHTHTHTHTTESANVKVQNIFHGRFNSTCNTNCKYRTAATLYPRNVVCFRCIIVCTLHESDNKDDDDNNNNIIIIIIM